MENIIKNQKEFFNQGYTISTSKRVSLLKSLRDYLKENEDLIYKSLEKDLGKCTKESYYTELLPVYAELNLAIRKLKKWSKTKRVCTNFINFPAKSLIKPCPLGQVLIISPWNYPLQLALIPLISAISAGNTVVLKPSSEAKYTTNVVVKILEAVFERGHVDCVLCSDTKADKLLELDFNHIFFTGSTAVGKKIAQKAAQNLIPVTLELGGKSPCIIDKSVNLSLAAKRIVWGKFINAGQTCVAPDYILIPPKLKNRLANLMSNEITKMYGRNPLLNDEYCKIINQKHHNRLKNLLGDSILFGGNFDDDTLKIEPTIISANLGDIIMKEEIFGPILPILEYNSLAEAKEIISQNPNPLALYVFSKRKSFIRNITSNIAFGGGSVNDTIMHLTNPKLPFGGIMQSGVGKYHGKFGFDTFTHYKSLFIKPKCEFKLKYPPYNKKRKK